MYKPDATVLTPNDDGFFVYFKVDGNFYGFDLHQSEVLGDLDEYFNETVKGAGSIQDFKELYVICNEELLNDLGMGDNKDART